MLSNGFVVLFKTRFGTGDPNILRYTIVVHSRVVHTVFQIPSPNDDTESKQTRRILFGISTHGYIQYSATTRRTGSHLKRRHNACRSHASICCNIKGRCNNGLHLDNMSCSKVVQSP
ncbi:hypothetical protein TNCV_3042081 [Trichonephila clavipes]|nr:hypothetical protein TNCV_3042081 [Trichonephila clavipes]